MALDEQLRQLADRVPPPPAGDPQAAFRQGQRRRRRRRTSTVSGLAFAVLGVIVVVTQTVTGPQLVIEPTSPVDRSVLAVPEPGAAIPAHLEDGTAVFVSHVDSGEVVVLDATSPDNQSLLAFCERGGGLEDPRHGSSFTADGTWIFGPSPTGLASYPYEHVGDGQIRVTGPARQAPPRPADGVPPSELPNLFCFNTETGDHPDRARYHQPDRQPPSGVLELSRDRWQWIRGDLEVHDGTVLLCETAPCPSDALEVPAPYENWVNTFRRDGHDRLLLARLNEDGTVDVRLPVTAGGHDVLDSQVDQAVAELQDGEHFGFLTAFTPTKLTFDPAEILFDEEATAAAIEDGELAPGQTLPNPFYVRNPDPTTVDLPIAATFTAQLIDNVDIAHRPVTADELAALYDGSGDTTWVYGLLEHLPAELTVDNGEVIRVVEIYLP